MWSMLIYFVDSGSTLYPRLVVGESSLVLCVRGSLWLPSQTGVQQINPLVGTMCNWVVDVGFEWIFEI